MRQPLGAYYRISVNPIRVIVGECTPSNSLHDSEFHGILSLSDDVSDEEGCYEYDNEATSRTGAGVTT